jgi:hypothetical protein
MNKSRSKGAVLVTDERLPDNTIFLRLTRETIDELTGEVLWTTEQVPKNMFKLRGEILKDWTDGEDTHMLITKEQAIVLVEMLQFAIDNMEKAWEV